MDAYDFDMPLANTQHVVSHQYGFGGNDNVCEQTREYALKFLAEIVPKNWEKLNLSINIGSALKDPFGEPRFFYASNNVNIIRNLPLFRRHFQMLKKYLSPEKIKPKFSNLAQSIEGSSSIFLFFVHCVIKAIRIS